MTKPPLDELIRFRISKKLKARAHKLAKRRDCGLSDIARAALIDFVETSEAKAATAAEA